MFFEPVHVTGTMGFSASGSLVISQYAAAAVATLQSSHSLPVTGTCCITAYKVTLMHSQCGNCESRLGAGFVSSIDF